MESCASEGPPEDSNHSKDEMDTTAEYSLSLTELRQRMRGDGYSWVDEVITFLTNN